MARDLLNACVRMVRADYCGRGEAATTAGTLIAFSDRFGIAGALPPPPGFAFEASWGPDGALCVAHPRRAAFGDLAAIVARCPRLIGRVGARSCKPGTGLIDSLSRP